MDALLAALCIFSLSAQVCMGSPEEQRLVETLLTDYNREILPRQANNETFKLAFQPGLRYFDVDDKGIASFYTWERYKWVDYRLAWDPKIYNGLSHVAIKLDRIWSPYPDWRLVSSVQTVEDSDTSVYSELYSDGQVILALPATKKAPCKYLEVSDTWNCTFWYASWSYGASSLMPEFYSGKPEMELNLYQELSPYEVVSNTARIKVVKYDCCEERFPDMSYFLEMRKKKDRILPSSTSAGNGLTFIFSVPILLSLLSQETLGV